MEFNKGSNNPSSPHFESSQSKVDLEIVPQIRKHYSYVFSTKFVHMKAQKNCVTGKEFVNWLLNQKLCNDRTSAVQLGQELLEKKVVVSVRNNFFKQSF